MNSKNSFLRPWSLLYSIFSQRTVLSFFIFLFQFFLLTELGYDMLGLFLSLCCVISPNRRSALLCCTPLGYVKPVAWIFSLSVMTKGKKWAFVFKAHVYASYAPNTHIYCCYVKIKESELLQKNFIQKDQFVKTLIFWCNSMFYPF